MKSPVTGKDMSLQKEIRTIIFRKEEVSVVYHFWLCKDSNEQFTSTELDETNMLQVYNKYRERHHLPFPDQIKAIREKYGLSAIKMSEILGFGVNMYRNYENGEVPSASNARLIQLANDPVKFNDLVMLSGVYEDGELQKVLERIERVISTERAAIWSFNIEDYLLDFDKNIGIMTGYTKPSLEKLRQMIIYFTARMQPWKTKMNKLLFYADFLNFRKTCFSISGTQYRAIDMGPVPNNFSSIFEYAAESGDIDIKRFTFSNGGLGEQFQPTTQGHFDTELFSETELQTLKEVADKFKKTTVNGIIETSHEERAWYENFQEGKKLISYDYAFDLITI